MTLLYWLLALLVVAGLLRVAGYLLADFRLISRPPLPPMRAWKLSTDHCRRPMARPLDPETLEPVGEWRAMPCFTGPMRVVNGTLYAREWASSMMEELAPPLPR